MTAEMFPATPANGLSPPSGLRVPDGWSGISKKVELFVRCFFRQRPEIDVTDVTQEVLFQLFRSYQVRPEWADLDALALLVARRRCIDALRRSYLSRRILQRVMVGENVVPASHPAPDHAHEQGEIRHLFLRLHDRLTPRCRIVLDQLLLGWRLSEIARSLGTTSGAVRNRWFDCRRQIRGLLQEWGIRREDLVG